MSTPADTASMSASSAVVLVLSVVALLAVGFVVRAAFRSLKVPPAVSLMALGIAVGPAALDILPDAWLGTRTATSAAAFVVLLVRAGSGVSPRTLRAIAAPSLALGLGPVAAEFLVAFALLRATLFQSWSMAALGGFLIAAVSPAVVLPVALAQKHAGRGSDRHVPDLIMGQTIVNAVVAAAAIPLTLALILRPVQVTSVVAAIGLVPVAAVAGAVIGAGIGVVARVDRLASHPIRRAGTVGAAALLLVLGSALYTVGARWRWLDGVAAALALAVAFRWRLGRDDPAVRMALLRVWSVAEIVLFVNLGSAIRVDAISDASLVLTAIPILAAALATRLIIGWGMSRRAPLTLSERKYVTIAHLPKATIQAVFGALPLLTFQQFRPDLVGHGEVLLLIAALAIVTTAPVGAVALERWGERLLPTSAPDRAVST